MHAKFKKARFLCSGSIFLVFLGAASSLQGNVSSLEPSTQKGCHSQKVSSLRLSS